MITMRPYGPAKEPRVAGAELAADKTRYDTRFATPLANAYLTGLFELPQTDVPQEKTPSTPAE